MTEIEKDCRLHWLFADRIFFTEMEFARRLDEATANLLYGPGNGNPLLAAALGLDLSDFVGAR